MVGWHVSLKTPQFPHGRPLIIVANDCTVQSGSFGIAEDEFFDKVSKYARGLGLPRLHIASNSGARIGLAEELKPYFKVRTAAPCTCLCNLVPTFSLQISSSRFALPRGPRSGMELESHCEWKRNPAVNDISQRVAASRLACVERQPPT
jgi:hypothetical protein